MSQDAHGKFEQRSAEEQERLIDAALNASTENADKVSDPALRQALDEQHAIDGALSRLFEVPASDRVMQAVHARINQDNQPRAIPQRDRAWWQRSGALAGLAASLIMTTAGIWLIINTMTSTTNRQQQYVTRHGSFIEVYHQEQSLGFKEQWVCKTDQEFASYFYLDFGQAVLLDAMPQGVAAIGLSYADTMSTKTILLLGRVDGADVLLFIDRLDQDPGLSQDVAEGLNVFRWELGSLVMYEVTPLDEMRLAPLIRPIEMPEEWKPRGRGG